MNGNVKNWAEEREESKKEDAKNTLYRNKVGWSGGDRRGRGADFQSYLDNWALLEKPAGLCFAACRKCFRKAAISFAEAHSVSE